MKKIHMKAIGNSIKVYMTKHSPEILTGIGIGGFLTTIGMTMKIAPRAKAEIEDAEYYADKYNEPIRTRDRVKIYAKNYWPVALSTGLSTACIVMGNRQQHKRNAALAAAYTISQETLKDYQSAITESLDEKKANEIREKVSQKTSERIPANDQEIPYVPSGKSLYFDRWSGRYFVSDRETLREICNNLSRQMLGDMYITLNDVYDAIDLDRIPFGNDIGWDVNKSFIEPMFSSKLTEKGEPCVVFDYTTQPEVLN